MFYIYIKNIQSTYIYCVYYMQVVFKPSGSGDCRKQTQIPALTEFIF